MKFFQLTEMPAVYPTEDRPPKNLRHLRLHYSLRALIQRHASYGLLEICHFVQTNAVVCSFSPEAPEQQLT